MFSYFAISYRVIKKSFTSCKIGLLCHYFSKGPYNTSINSGGFSSSGDKRVNKFGDLFKKKVFTQFPHK